MTRVAMTGANGFLGWHTRAALREQDAFAIPIGVGAFFDLSTATSALDGADRAIHIAGVNRASDEDIEAGNVLFAEQMASALRVSANPPAVVVYANSAHVGNGSVYGAAKERAATILANAANELGIQFVDLRLSNLFGEHGRPFYNSVTATFSHLLAQGDQPRVQDDKMLTLLHAQDAADLLLGTVVPTEQAALEVEETVTGLLRRLSHMAKTYRRGEVPDIAASFDRDLFNTYRSFAFPTQTPVQLARHADQRGSFFETIRSHGGPGQSSFSTTAPGVTRGDHFHRRKIERFTVLSGHGRIALRRLFTDEVIEFDVDGEQPGAIDMPTMWSHNITNVGDETLYTSFWTNDIFDPGNPDTIAEVV